MEGRDDEPPVSKEIIVLESIRNGITKFGRIQKTTRLPPEELNSILERLERQGDITVKEKKGWLGTKIELNVTKSGSDKVDEGIREMQAKWGQMQAIYKSGDKEKMRSFMDSNRSILPMMLFFGVIDMMMFSMMFSMIGMPMASYVPPESVPEDMDDGDAGMDDGDGGGGDAGMGDGGGFDFDVGF